MRHCRTKSKDSRTTTKHGKWHLPGKNLWIAGSFWNLPVFCIVKSRFRNPPAWHRALPGPSGPEPQESPKGVHPGASGPGEPQRVHPGVRKESKKSPKLRFGLFSDSGAHSLGTLGLPGAGGPGTPFRTLFGLFWGSGPEGPGSTLCQAGGFPNRDSSLWRLVGADFWEGDARKHVSVKRGEAFSE